MKKYQYLFGPVPSRRLGRSLGVDIIPYKTCSFDCVFCQLGQTTNRTIRRDQYVLVRDVINEIKDWLSFSSKADFVTLAGSGEPTLHSNFGDVIAFIRKYSNIPVALFTNGTTLHVPEVRNMACQADLVKISLSAWDQASMERMNRPCANISFDQLIEGQKAFKKQFKGELRMEVFIVEGINTSKEMVCKIAQLIKSIGPDQVQLNTATRPPAEKSVGAVPEKLLAELAMAFDPPAELIGDFSPCISRDALVKASDILSMLKRHPCTSHQIADALCIPLNEASKHLKGLIKQGCARIEERDGNEYFTVH